MAGDGTIAMLTTGPSSDRSSDYYIFYDYEDIDFSQAIVLATLYIIISITGILGNLLVVFAIILSRKLRSTTNWFVMNLACADLLTSICVVSYAVDAFSWDVSSSWLFSIASSVALACVGVSLTTHALIGFTSWFLITKRHATFIKLYSNRNVGIMIAFSWLLTFICVIVIYIAGRTYLYAGECILGIWIIGHFGVIITVYIKLWSFVAQREKTMPSRQKSSAQSKSESENSVKISEKSIVIPLKRSTRDNLEVSQNRDHSAVKEYPRTCEKVDTASSEIYETDLSTSDILEEKGRQELGIISNTSPAEDHLSIRVHNPASIDTIQKQIKPKLNKMFIIVSKNLFVVLATFVFCFIPFCICLYVPASSNVEPWFQALLFFNSCINPVIYARRIRAFREVMVCIIRCRLGAIPMPIEPLRRWVQTD